MSSPNRNVAREAPAVGLIDPSGPAVDDRRAPRSVVRHPRFGDDWWQRGVIYQIYPRSFADSDGDGIGDLRGIIDHLDYLGPDGLAIDAIWLSPIYPSPGLDLGYDVSDHEHVDALLGSEADFDELVAEAHRHGIRVILDLVMNHTSDAHPWFVASRASRTGPFADWYLWRDPDGFEADGTPRPPNNWVSFFGGPGWQWDDGRRQFYFHTFLREQPELDWRTPAVEEAQWRMVQGWLDRGVDGFRLDVFNAFLKHPDLLSNATRPGDSPWERQEHLNDRDQPDLAALIGRFRAIVDAEPGRMSVGELFDGTVEAAASLSTAGHLVFDWELLRATWDAAELRAAIARRESGFGPDRWPCVVLSNHDQPRQASRLAASAGIADRDAVARAAAVLLLTLRGTPFIFYGEELGMGDVDIPPEESVDPPASRTDLDFEWWDRSRCRTPMQWSTDPNAGFTSGRPWLRVAPDAALRNAAVETADPMSVLSTYRRLLALRTASPALQIGTLRQHDIEATDIVAYSREGAGQTFLILLNTSPAEATYALAGLPDVPHWRTVLSTASIATGEVHGAVEDVRLGPNEARILEAVR